MRGGSAMLHAHSAHPQRIISRPARISRPRFIVVRASENGSKGTNDVPKTTKRKKFNMRDMVAAKLEEERAERALPQASFNYTLFSMYDSTIY